MELPIRVYLAGRYSKRDELRQYAERLRHRGVEVTSSWLEETLPLDVNHYSLTTTENVGLAQTDLRDIDRAHLVIFFAEDAEKQPPRGGRHVEFGYALAQHKPIYVIGKEENVFHYLPAVLHWDSFDDVLEVVSAVQAAY